jgi:tetratricopeptide (TPR) repeat protein
MCAMGLGDYPAARAHYEAALDYQKEQKILRTPAAPLTNLGLVCWYQGDFVSAERYFTDSLQEDRATGDREGEARSLLNLGLVACVQGEMDRSQSLLEASLLIRREMKDQHGLVNVLGNLGEIFLKQNKEAEAKAALTESLFTARTLKDNQQIAYALGILGLIATRQEEFRNASQLLSESLTILVELGDRFHLQNALEACAGLAYAVACRHRKNSALLGEKATASFGCAVRFWSAADMLRAEIGSFLLEEDKAVRDEQITKTRDALGARTFEAQQAAGKSQTLNDLAAEMQHFFLPGKNLAFL